MVFITHNFTVKDMFEIAVTEEVERWKGQYETERNLVSRLQEQLNEEVER